MDIKPPPWRDKTPVIVTIKVYHVLIMVVVSVILAWLLVDSILGQESRPEVGITRAGMVACEGDETWKIQERLKSNGKAWLNYIEERIAERACVRTLPDGVVYYGPSNVVLPEALVVVFMDREDAPESRAWFVHHSAIPDADSALWVVKPKVKQ